MECAVWYFRYGGIYFELCSDEQEAARYAVGLEDAENGAVAGIQFENGDYIDRDVWREYAAEQKLQDQLTDGWIKKSSERPKPATRQVTVPWDSSRTVTVDASSPSWLGKIASRPGSSPGPHDPSQDGGPGH